MKKHQTKFKKFNLAGYAALASSFLTMGKEAYAQAVYVDINPDSVLTSPSDGIVLELNNSGLID